MKNRLFIILIALFLVLTGCTVETIVYRNITFNYEDGLNQADLVVIGHFESYKNSWNMARNIEDSSKESEDYYVEGKLYSFVIEEVIKGVCDSDTIEINQRYSDDYSGKVELDKYFIEVEYSQKYVLFLTYNEMFNHYYGVFNPFIFTINNDIIHPCANGDEIEDIIGDMDISSILMLVE